MELSPGNRKVYLRPGPTDSRKSINTLAIIVCGRRNEKEYILREHISILQSQERQTQNAVLGQEWVLYLTEKTGGK